MGVVFSHQIHENVLHSSTLSTGLQVRGIPPPLCLVTGPSLVTIGEVTFAFYHVAVLLQPKFLVRTVLFPPAQHVE